MKQKVSKSSFYYQAFFRFKKNVQTQFKLIKFSHRCQWFIEVYGSTLHGHQLKAHFHDRFQGPYSQHFIFFLTFKCFQQARVLNYTWPEKHDSDKHSNLLDPFITYEENKVL
jgi:hypothetical protein